MMTKLGSVTTTLNQEQDEEPQWGMHAVCERKEMVEVTENLNLKKNEKAVLSINQLFN